MAQVIPTRFGVKFEPCPTLAMEYKTVNGNKDILVMKIQNKINSSVQNLFDELCSEYPEYINREIINTDQVKRLLQLIVENKSTTSTSTSSPPAKKNPTTSPVKNLSPVQTLPTVQQQIIEKSPSERNSPIQNNNDRDEEQTGGGITYGVENNNNDDDDDDDDEIESIVEDEFDDSFDDFDEEGSDDYAF